MEATPSNVWILSAVISVLWVITLALLGMWGKNVVEQLKMLNKTSSEQGAEIAVLKASLSERHNDIGEIKNSITSIHRRIDSFATLRNPV